MTSLLPAGLGHRATATLARSALPDAPTRAFAPSRFARHGWCRKLARRLSRPTERVEPTKPELTELVDVDPYTVWRDAATLSADALRSWNRAAPSNRAVAHAIYRAALDDEDAAATALARLQRSPPHAAPTPTSRASRR